MQETRTLLRALHAVPENILQPLVLEEFSASNQMQQLLWAKIVLAMAVYQAAICEAYTNLLPRTAADNMLARVMGISALAFDQVSKDCVERVWFTLSCSRSSSHWGPVLIQDGPDAAAFYSQQQPVMDTKLFCCTDIGVQG